MGAGASSTDQEQVCFGYWDTSTNSIHMVRMKSTSLSHEDETDEEDGSDAQLTDAEDVRSDEDIRDDNPTESSISSSNTTTSSSTSSQSSYDMISTTHSCYQRLLETVNEKYESQMDATTTTTTTSAEPQSLLTNCTHTKPLKTTSIINRPQILLHKRLKIGSNNQNYSLFDSNVRNKTEERRVSSVKLEEMESVEMPLKAAKILVGDPMKIKGKKDSDSEDECFPSQGHFDIISLQQERQKKNRKEYHNQRNDNHLNIHHHHSNRLPFVRSPRPNRAASLLNKSSSGNHSAATILSTYDTQITMILPRKAAQILLGERQKRSLLSVDRSCAVENRIPSPVRTRHKPMKSVSSSQC